jgi:hypothetical protein
MSVSRDGDRRRNCSRNDARRIAVRGGQSKGAHPDRDPDLLDFTPQDAADLQRIMEVVSELSSFRRRREKLKWNLSRAEKLNLERASRKRQRILRHFPPLLCITSRENFRRRQQHTCDQNAECDVVETVCENVHGVALTAPEDSVLGA